MRTLQMPLTGLAETRKNRMPDTYTAMVGIAPRRECRHKPAAPPLPGTSLRAR